MKHSIKCYMLKKKWETHSMSSILNMLLHKCFDCPKNNSCDSDLVIRKVLR